MASDWMKFKDFTPEQDEALVKILSNPDKDFLIKGCAGSGKTILGMALYKQTQADNKTAGFLVFPKLLKEFARDYCSGFAKPYNILHYHQWKKQKTIHYDTAIIDETQDFEEEWVEDVSNNSKRRIWLGDERQQIYERDTQAVMSKVSSNLSRERQIVLTMNLRNPFCVALLASCFLPVSERKFFIDHLLQGEEQLAGSSNKGGLVHFARASSEKEEYDALAAKIKSIHGDSYGKSHIAVVQYKNAEVENVAKELSSRNVSCYHVNVHDDNPNYPDFNQKKITMLCTMHSLKGLECDYIIFPRAHLSLNYHATSGSDNIRDNLLHVLFTRARTAVYCSYTDTGTSNYLYKTVMGHDLDLGSGQRIPVSVFVKEINASEVLGNRQLNQSAESPSASADKDMVRAKINNLITAFRNR